MVTVEFEFPVKKDAYIFRDNLNKFFSGSFFETEEQIILSKITKSKNETRSIWSFKLNFCKDHNDTDISEKYMKISGGTLDIMNGARQVWAFS